jgi:hypothetical protein
LNGFNERSNGHALDKTTPFRKKITNFRF